MKVTYISHAKFPSRYANSVHIIKMCNAFVKRGYNVQLIIPGNPFSAKRKRRIIDFYDLNIDISILFIPKLPTIIGLWLFAFVAIIMAGIRKCEYCYTRTIHVSYLLCKFGKRNYLETHAPILMRDRKYFNYILKSDYLIKLVLISNKLREIFSTEYGQVTKYYVAHDGADESSDRDDLVKVNLNCDKTQLVIGYFGSFHKGRGIEQIIELAKLCNWGLFYLFGGENNQIEYWKNQSRDIVNLNIFGFVPPKDVLSYMNACDILIAPYQKKVFLVGNKADTSMWMSPMKIFEYMSAGKPIISSDHEVLKEILVDQENSILLSPNDQKAWVSALNMLASNPKLRRKLGTQAELDLNKNFTWEKRVAHITEDINF